MGTNYYWHEGTPCPTCGHNKTEPRHIGKSSAGWVFSLHIYPEENIHDLHDWLPRLLHDGEIKDEYGQSVAPDQMLRIILVRYRCPPTPPLDVAFFRTNHAVPGPLGLARTALGYCHKHGDGTYDLHTGDFS